MKPPTYKVECIPTQQSQCPVTNPGNLDVAFSRQGKPRTDCPYESQRKYCRKVVIHAVHFV